MDCDCKHLPFGRPDRPAHDPRRPYRFHLQQIPLDKNGRDHVGVFWGYRAVIWWAYTPDAPDVEFFFHAADYRAAKRETLKRHPGARFFR